MNEKPNQALALAALSTLNIQAQIEVSDEEVAGFIDKTLDEQQHQKVLSAFAKNPQLLSSAIDTYNALDLFEQETAVQLIKKRFSLVNWFKQHWLSTGSMGSAVAAAFAYVMIMPVTDLGQLDNTLSGNFYHATVDADSFYKQLPSTKRLRTAPTNNNEEHFQYGYQLALSELEFESNLLAEPYCSSEKACTVEKSYQLLGKWTGLTLAQCNSDYSVSISFWQSQAEIIEGLLANIDHKQLSKLYSGSDKEQDLCIAAQAINKKLN